MIEFDCALKAVLGAAEPLAPERVGLGDCVGQVLAQDLKALGDLPSFDNSAMDGFAVRAQDLSAASLQTPVVLRLGETIRAGGAVRSRLKPLWAFKIMTGAPLPHGADAVVAREWAEEEGGSVKMSAAPILGEHVRRRGEDVRRGQLLLRAGTVLRPYEVALLAAQGMERIPVVRRPKVAVFSSGDEIVPWDKVPGPGRIRDSNGPALEASLRRWGYPCVLRGILPDVRERMRSMLLKALRVADALVVAGGVSVGDFDYTRGVLEYLGLKTLFWRVAIKPGRPLLFGTWKQKLVFGLPGNPLSSLVCAEEFVRPALDRLAGRAGEPTAYPLRGVMAKSFAKPKDRLQYVFCSASRQAGNFVLDAVRPQGSAMMGAASRANALALAPLGVSRLEIGTEVAFRWLA